MLKWRGASPPPLPPPPDEWGQMTRFEEACCCGLALAAGRAEKRSNVARRVMAVIKLFPKIANDVLFSRQYGGGASHSKCFLFSLLLVSLFSNVWDPQPPSSLRMSFRFHIVFIGKCFVFGFDFTGSQL